MSDADEFDPTSFDEFNTDDVPELLPAHLSPPVRSQADLHRQWRALLGDLGFAGTSLWFLFLEGDGRPTPYVSQIEDLPDLPDREGLENLMTMLRAVMDAELPEDASVAFLRSRPGRSALSRFDLLWAEKLRSTARAAGIASWPVHLATDESLVVIAPDDIAAAKSA